MAFVIGFLHFFLWALQGILVGVQGFIEAGS